MDLIPSYQLIQYEKVEGSFDYIVSIKESWLFWSKIKRYRGNCTVWHNEDTGARLGTSKECLLSDFWFLIENDKVKDLEV